MSKNKTKRARREAKREHHKKASKLKPQPTTNSSKPLQTAQQKKQKANAKAQKPPPHTQASQQQHPIPFGEYDNILLVGEGDFSFTRSLVVEHGCANVTATSFDSEDELRKKYPTFPTIHSELTALTPPVPFHYTIDATKLSTYKCLKPTAHSPYDIIAFQFPHTGGLSRDVNRQVRANQALLVAFLRSCLETGIVRERRKLAVEKQRSQKLGAGDAASAGGGASAAMLGAKSKTASAGEEKEFLRTGGKIIVTLFEGEPYTLWNIRDLARHTGLKVVESFRFDWERYPGYRHVRTLGAIDGGGGWKGEDREARMYVFEKVGIKDEDGEGEDGRSPKKQKKGRKRAREGSGDSGSSDDD
ncbi:uncharacterized protein BDR25DRAFT_105530 [Lindgomyces ingoldianus]|uniref:Uncharacterized protein n=1 Tax=Lindgomyces ingoldianus TaxID=673940 RepID=A0ACB6QAD6_9PLEO|nr:uncharacterized protein BDR25DRAFT_105530 [Lindgomyces ingoldianus]KAF2463924.1 hypothetical protein BDR25DRAFT_105530 [Lindgomyces ingoldianus]